MTLDILNEFWTIVCRFYSLGFVGSELRSQCHCIAKRQSTKNANNWSIVPFSIMCNFLKWQHFFLKIDTLSLFSLYGTRSEKKTRKIYAKHQLRQFMSARKSGFGDECTLWNKTIWAFNFLLHQHFLLIIRKIQP